MSTRGTRKKTAAKCVRLAPPVLYELPPERPNDTNYSAGLRMLLGASPTTGIRDGETPLLPPMPTPRHFRSVSAESITPSSSATSAATRRHTVKPSPATGAFTPNVVDHSATPGVRDTQPPLSELRAYPDACPRVCKLEGCVRNAPSRRAWHSVVKPAAISLSRSPHGAALVVPPPSPCHFLSPAEGMLEATEKFDEERPLSLHRSNNTLGDPLELSGSSRSGNSSSSGNSVVSSGSWRQPWGPRCGPPSHAAVVCHVSRGCSVGCGGPAAQDSPAGGRQHACTENFEDNRSADKEGTIPLEASASPVADQCKACGMPGCSPRHARCDIYSHFRPPSASRGALREAQKRVSDASNSARRPTLPSAGIATCGSDEAGKGGGPSRVDGEDTTVASREVSHTTLPHTRNMTGGARKGDTDGSDSALISLLLSCTMEGHSTN